MTRSTRSRARSTRADTLLVTLPWVRTNTQVPVFRWLTVVLSFVIAGFVVRDLLNSYDAMQTMNAARSVDANVGTGLWIMIVSAAIAMIASVRLSEDQKID